MNEIITVMKREVRLGFRNPWSYTFLVLFIIFMLSLLLINGQGYTSGYSGMTGMLINLTLYLLPLITLMLGSFSLTGEKEDGSAQLLYTYQLSSSVLLIGKYVGVLIVLLTIVTVAFSVTGIVSTIFTEGFAVSTYLLLFIFASCIIIAYLSMAFLIGAITKNRWQALTYVIAVWFFTIIGWVPILIAALGQLPYLWIKPVLTIATLLNPAEWIRIYTIVTLGGGSIIGPEYYNWVTWIRDDSGSFAFGLLLIFHVILYVGCASWLWERGKRHG